MRTINQYAEVIGATPQLAEMILLGRDVDTSNFDDIYEQILNDAPEKCKKCIELAGMAVDLCLGEDAALTWQMIHEYPRHCQLGPFLVVDEYTQLGASYECRSAMYEERDQ